MRVAYLFKLIVYLYERGFRFADRAFDFSGDAAMKHQRLDAIREVLAKSPVANQDELRDRAVMRCRMGIAEQARRQRRKTTGRHRWQR